LHGITHAYFLYQLKGVSLKNTNRSREILTLQKKSKSVTKLLFKHTLKYITNYEIIDKALLNYNYEYEL